jgi:hypothetical protein
MNFRGRISAGEQEIYERHCRGVMVVPARAHIMQASNESAKVGRRPGVDEP